MRLSLSFFWIRTYPSSSNSSLFANMTRTELTLKSYTRFGIWDQTSRPGLALFAMTKSTIIWRLSEFKFMPNRSNNQHVNSLEPKQLLSFQIENNRDFILHWQWFIAIEKTIRESMISISYFTINTNKRKPNMLKLWSYLLKPRHCSLHTCTSQTTYTRRYKASLTPRHCLQEEHIA